MFLLLRTGENSVESIRMSTIPRENAIAVRANNRNYYSSLTSRNSGNPNQSSLAIKKADGQIGYVCRNGSADVYDYVAGNYYVDRCGNTWELYNCAYYKDGSSTRMLINDTMTIDFGSYLDLTNIKFTLQFFIKVTNVEDGLCFFTNDDIIRFGIMYEYNEKYDRDDFFFTGYKGNNLKLSPRIQSTLTSNVTVSYNGAGTFTMTRSSYSTTWTVNSVRLRQVTISPGNGGSLYFGNFYWNLNTSTGLNKTSLFYSTFNQSLKAETGQTLTPTGSIRWDLSDAYNGRSLVVYAANSYLTTTISGITPSNVGITIECYCYINENNVQQRIFEVGGIGFYTKVAAYTLKTGEHRLTYCVGTDGITRQFCDGKLIYEAKQPATTDLTTVTIGTGSVYTREIAYFEMRVSRGVRYTSEYTPKEEMLDYDSNTVFLVHF